MLKISDFCRKCGFNLFMPLKIENLVFINNEINGIIRY